MVLGVHVCDFCVYLCVRVFVILCLHLCLSRSCCSRAPVAPSLPHLQVCIGRPGKSFYRNQQ